MCKKLLSFFLCMAIAAAFAFTTVGFSAEDESPSVSVSAEYIPVSEGETLTLSVGISSADEISSLTIAVVFDTSVLEFDYGSGKNSYRDFSFSSINQSVSDESMICITCAEVDGGIVCDGLFAELKFNVIGSLGKTPFEIFGRDGEKSFCDTDGDYLLADYTVTSASPVSLYIASLPAKTEYLYGQPLSTLGLEVYQVYSNGVAAAVASPSVSGYDCFSPGVQAITVSCGSLSTVFYVTVYAVTGIYVASLPSKTSYVKGEFFIRPGLTVNAVYENGAEAPVSPTVYGFDPGTLGIQTMVVEYLGFFDTFEVCVYAPEDIARIEITAAGKYLQAPGSEPSTDGLVVTAYCYDGSSSIIDDYEISEIDTSVEGIQTVTVTYGSKTASYEVLVAQYLLSIQSLPDKLTYTEDTVLDMTGFVLNAEYPDGTVAAVDGYTVSTDIASPGVHTVTVTYGGYSIGFDVTVVQRVLCGIEIGSLPSRTVYLVGNASIDRTGLVVNALYDNGQSESVNFALKGQDFSETGEKTLTVIYKSFTATFTVDVYLAGDIDRNDAVTSSDARLALSESLLGNTLTSDEKLIADCDGSETVTSVDARTILILSLGS